MCDYEKEQDLRLIKDERYQLGIQWCIKTLQNFNNSSYASLDPRHMALKLAKHHLEKEGIINV